MRRRPIYASIVAPPATKAAVRIRIQGADNMEPAELLDKAEIHIESAYLVRKLRGNDTEVFVQSVSQRDNAFSMAQLKEFCVLKQNYPVEILGIHVGSFIRGENPNNGEFMIQIVAEIKVRIPELKIKRVRWLFDGKENRWMGTIGHTRGSIVASLPTEAHRCEVIRIGIVYKPMLSTAQLWSPRAQVKQCFNCCQWGRTQASCNKARKCGECTGTHQTSKCPRKSALFCNCGKNHKSWQKGVCQNFAAYKVSV